MRRRMSRYQIGILGDEILAGIGTRVGKNPFKNNLPLVSCRLSQQ
jgi:hypothetical protein